MSKKFYSVSMIAQCVVFVEAENEDEALSLASDYTSSNDYTFVEATAKLIQDDPQAIDSHKRHADVVVP